MALSLLGTGTAGVGLLQSACGIGAIVGAALSVVLIRPRPDLGLGLVLWARRPSPSPPGLGSGSPCSHSPCWCRNSIVDIAGVTLIQRTAPPSAAGRVFGLLESMIVAVSRSARS